MQNFVLYSDVDTLISDRMANQIPDINKRLRAINLELDALQTEYDIFDAVREATLSIITDGSTAYSTSVLLTDNDLKSIKDFNLGTDENLGSPMFTPLDLPEFTRKVESGLSGNYYTLYTKEGVQYLNVLTMRPSTTVTSIKMLYHTTYKALDNADDFIPSVINAAGVKILLPKRFTELVGLGAIKRLFYPAIGEDSNSYMSTVNKEYNEWKDKLGLTSAAKPSVKMTRKLRLRKQW